MVYGKSVKKRKAGKQYLIPYTLHRIPLGYGLEKICITEVLLYYSGIDIFKLVLRNTFRQRLCIPLFLDFKETHLI